jgi:glycine/D-amino acid oxidase-like deaminating enzyme/nitrite reductase/ring-hydroxylating ferredoxin subunit
MHVDGPDRTRAPLPSRICLDRRLVNRSLKIHSLEGEIRRASPSTAFACEPLPGTPREAMSAGLHRAIPPSRADRTSLWLATSESAVLPPLTGTDEVDVAVVGGGIVGLTTALLAAQQGRSVLIVEGARLASGVSGFTTAKVTAGHRLAYSRLERDHGADAARLYAEAQQAGLEIVRSLVQRYDIVCDLESLPNYVVAQDESELDAIEEEAAAARRAGLSARVVTDVDAPFPSVGAVELSDQSQFHPRRYLLGLADVVLQAGGKIAERSGVLEITGDGPYLVRTEHGEVRATAVVVATNYPIVDPAFFATRIHPSRSYVVAARLAGDSWPSGMYINVGSPTRSVRTAPLEDGGRVAIVSGEGHRVGQEPSTEERYALLERFMREHLDVGETLYRWSTQDAYSVDGLPFVGRVNDQDLFVATGFAAWGMTNGTAAALTIVNDIAGKRLDWADVSALDRATVRASATDFVRENVNVAVQEITGALRGRDSQLADLGPGEADVVEFDGSAVAAYREPSGALHTVSAVCTHMGCKVSWNPAEASWDCPCHGSRFAPDGTVLHGPALRALEPVSTEDSH